MRGWIGCATVQQVEKKLLSGTMWVWGIWSNLGPEKKGMEGDYSVYWSNQKTHKLDKWVLGINERERCKREWEKNHPYVQTCQLWREAKATELSLKSSEQSDRKLRAMTRQITGKLFIPSWDILGGHCVKSWTTWATPFLYWWFFSFWLVAIYLLATRGPALTRTVKNVTLCGQGTDLRDFWWLIFF